MNTFAGTDALTRLALRRDRIFVPAWLLVFIGTAVFSAQATVDLYPTAASRVAAAESINRSQALVALYGRIYDPTSLGAVSMIKLGGFGALGVAILMILLTIRHTRADEEAGRLELVGATAVGRHAALGAALVVVMLASVALGFGTAIGLTAVGLPLDGSVAFGAAWAGVGIAFGAVAAVTAQLTESRRSAVGIASVVLAVVYALRAVGDAAATGLVSWLSWLSPIGWAQQFRPYAGNRWWVLAITVAFAAALVVSAFALASHRDIGAGFMQPRPGPADASPRLRSAPALAWRLQRGMFVAWVIGFALLGALLGGIASSVGEFFNNPSAEEFIRRLGGRQGLVDAYFAVELAFCGIFAAAYGMLAVLRMRTEETEQRAEPVLATAVGRVRWAGSHLAIAILGVIAVLLAAGTAAGTARAVAVGNVGEVGRITGAALAQVPTAAILVAVVVCIFGVRPSWCVASWGLLAAAIIVSEIGPLVGAPQWVLNLSPFTHAPRLPGSTWSVAPSIVSAVVAVGIGTVGLVGFRRRDIA